MAGEIDTSPSDSIVLRAIAELRHELKSDLAETKTDLRERLDEAKVHLDERIDETKKDLGGRIDEGVTEAKKTNGRLKRVELWVAAVKGVLAVGVVVGIPLGLKLIDHL